MCCLVLKSTVSLLASSSESGLLGTSLDSTYVSLFLPGSGLFLLLSTEIDLSDLTSGDVLLPFVRGSTSSTMEFCDLRSFFLKQVVHGKQLTKQSGGSSAPAATTFLALSLISSRLRSLFLIQPRCRLSKCNMSLYLLYVDAFLPSYAFEHLQHEGPILQFFYSDKFVDKRGGGVSIL